ncbi:MAG: ThiF family adenylyltransferase, partial [Frankiales bacterium]|nr:ThiF family adenylyltransferase [Frankiales bacterium]
MALDATPADRPRVKPALARVWRSPDTLQFGTGDSAWVLRDLSPALRSVLDLCDGTRPHADVVAQAAAAGVDPHRAGHFLSALASAGVLEDAGAGDPGLRDICPSERERLEPERASLSLARSRTSATTLAVRARAWVEIDGDARIVPLVAALFAAAGIGHVTATSTTRLTSYDA